MFEFVELPRGNGQEVYINLSLLGIDEELFSYDNYTLRVKTNPLSSHHLLHQIYNDAFALLEKMGYKIIINSDEVNDDTFFFTPCITQKRTTTQKEHYSQLDAKILKCLLKGKIKKPNTVPFLERFSPSYSPQLPIILKNEEKHGGVEKFLIKTPSQLELLKCFFASTGLYHDCKDMVIQEYIETPTDYNTSLRVLVASQGDIMSASLKYSQPEKRERESGDSVIEIYLHDPESPYFLGDESFVSNTLAGGRNILLGENNYSESERKILIAHGIDPDDAIVPESIRVACVEVMKNCSKELGSICGMDFIYDEKNKVWKYLEEHEYPMLHSYAMKYRLSGNTTGFYLDVDKMLDLRARMHSLSIAMNKKRNNIYQRQLIQES